MSISSCTRHNYLPTIWDALNMVREDLIPEGTPIYDNQWSEITSAMAFLTEDLNTDSISNTIINYLKDMESRGDETASNLLKSIIIE